MKRPRPEARAGRGQGAPGPLLRNADRTRHLLLEAACQEFAEKGLAGARVDEIARRAGVNKPMLYYHFGSKDNLFRAALEDRFRRFRERDRDLAVDAMPPEAALATLIGVTFDDLRASPDMIAMIMDENRERGRHLDPERMQSINAPLLVSIRRALEQGVRAGVFRAGVDAEQFYLSVLSLSGHIFTHAHTLSAILRRDLTTEAEIRARRAHIIDILLAAVRR